MNNNTLKSMTNEMDKLVRKTLYLKFKEAEDRIKEAILNKYDAELLDVVTDKNSKTNPNLYRDEFVSRLNSFSYIADNGSSLSIKTPDMENFDFSGRMQVLQTIMEGVIGIYIEMTRKEYMEVFKKPPLNERSIDDVGSASDIIYLVKDSPLIRKYEKDNKKQFTNYPFSNTPPFDILSEGSEFVEDNIDIWISDALEEAQRIFVKTYKGANI